ncbi:MAG TPA: non-reducing end alpha-L-arabinofuranosidase family hydrolase, partial [Polyangiaceae bacterium]|nr:non-reducing end alpha-L-arabinofuranosidase family hydrolase [Polyangiaceae bacterium]
NGGVDGGSATMADAETGDSAGAPTTCDLPARFKWKASGPLVAPKSPPGHDFVSIKDPTVVYWNGLFHIYATVYDRTTRGWNMVYLNFSDWSQANAAPQFYMQNSPTHGGVAPQLFYFTPKKKWVLVYQWGASFSVTDDPSKPETWSPPASLLLGAPDNALDFWVICDSANCYLFFSNDRGQLYQAQMPIERFPSAFSDAKVLMSDSAANLFEASNVFKVQGTDKYLLLVEAYGPRYFRSWTAANLAGPWEPLAATQQNPFAGKANVTFDGAAWTNDISHGDMIRTNPDETMTIDSCNMQFVFQGADPNANTGGDYGLTPYRLGVLTATP